MARIRTIKPEFWKHEDLSALPEATHMLAAALLNHADDEGYFNANPGLVKSECCPLREPSVSVQDSLKSLVRVGYIQVGTGADGKRYGRVVTFADHQRVNRPTVSKIKKMDIAWEQSSTTHEQLSEDSLPEGKGKEQGKEGNREGKGVTTPDGVVVGAAAAPPSGGLFGDEGDDVPVTKPARGGPPACPHDEIRALYHELLPMCRATRTWTGKRRKHLQARWREDPMRQNLDWWREFFSTIAESKFLTGRAKPTNGRETPFLADLAWIVSPENFAKILDDTYQ